jgi:hypothetical protein
MTDIQVRNTIYEMIAAEYAMMNLKEKLRKIGKNKLKKAMKGMCSKKELDELFGRLK